MSTVTRICLFILALGILIGLFMQGVSGGIVGFVLAGVIALPVYCLTKTFQRDAAAVNIAEDPFGASPHYSRNNDPSQLPKGAYEPNGRSVK
jgi:hypothetical protein